MDTTSPAIRRGGMMTAGDSQPELTAFQLWVARMFFARPGEQPCSHSTLRHGPPKTSTSSPPERGHVPAARDALEAAGRQRGWVTKRIHDSYTSCRMVIRSADDGVLIGLAVNAPPYPPASPIPAGPTLAPEELAGEHRLAQRESPHGRSEIEEIIRTDPQWLEHRSGPGALRPGGRHRA